MDKNDFIFSVPQLKAYLKERGYKAEKLDLPDIKGGFPLLIPKHYLDLIGWEDKNDPLKLMAVMSSLEEKVQEYEKEDPIGDGSYTRIPGLVHKYRDRCLLMLTNACAVHCRYCFRKNRLGKNTVQWHRSLEYIKKHKEIWEVIFSGGDPFMLTDHFLKQALDAIGKIPHVKMVRFHTRVPVVYPKRLDVRMLKTLAGATPVTVVIHINHPKEISPEFIRAVGEMRASGMLLLSQSVLLKGVNDDAQTLEKLFHRLVETGVKPYYLHHLDAALGTHHFRVSLKKGKEIMDYLRQEMSGVCLPQYVVDLPGTGKMPVASLKHIKGNTYAYESAIDTVLYEDFAPL